MNRLTVALGLLLSGCAAEPVIVEGRILAERNGVVGRPDAQVTLRDPSFERVDEARTDADGVFRVEAPRQSEVHLVVDGEGLVPTAFAGVSGVADVFSVPDGQLWSTPEALLAGWRTAFAGCPGAEDGDGVVVGEIRLQFAGSEGPIEASSVAWLEEEDGEGRVEACYLGETGGAYDPEATSVGETGLFAMFGVAGGPWLLQAGRPSTEGLVVGTTRIFVPEGGVVTPFPTLVPL